MKVSISFSLYIGMRVWCRDGYMAPDCSRTCTTDHLRVCSGNKSQVLPLCFNKGTVEI